MTNQIRTILGSLLCAALFGGLTSARESKGAGKPPPPTYCYGYTNLGQAGFNNFGGGAKGYGISEPDSNGVLTAVGGGSSTPSPNYGAVWEAASSGVLLSADTLPNSTRSTVAVNDAGMIAWYGYSNSQAANVGMVEIPSVGIVELYPGFVPRDINNLGQVVGTYSGAAWGWLLTVQGDGTIQFDENWSLGDFLPYAINDSREMAGQQGGHAAIAWFEDGVLRVQTLPGLFAGSYGRATAINNFGEVVGVSASDVIGTIGISGYYRPFLWDSVTGLVALTGNVQGAALDINDSGQVVGWSTNSKYYAFLWENGTLSDLNALSGVGTKTFRLGSAEAINNAGHIVGRSDTWKGTYTVSNGTYLLTPN